MLNQNSSLLVLTNRSSNRSKSGESEGVFDSPVNITLEPSRMNIKEEMKANDEGFEKRPSIMALNPLPKDPVSFRDPRTTVPEDVKFQTRLSSYRNTLATLSGGNTQVASMLLSAQDLATSSKDEITQKQNRFKNRQTTSVKKFVDDYLEKTNDRNPPTLLYERKVKLGKKAKKVLSSTNDGSPQDTMRIREYEMPLENYTRKMGTVNL